MHRDAKKTQCAEMFGHGYVALCTRGAYASTGKLFSFNGFDRKKMDIQCDWIYLSYGRFYLYIMLDD